MSATWCALAWLEQKPVATWPFVESFGHPWPMCVIQRAPQSPIKHHIYVLFSRCPYLKARQVCFKFDPLVILK